MEEDLRSKHCCRFCTDVDKVPVNIVKIITTLINIILKIDKNRFKNAFISPASQ